MWQKILRVSVRVGLLKAMDKIKDSDINAETLIEQLELKPHPEGGWYAQSWRDGPHSTAEGPRGVGSSIYYLLESGQRSHWHRIDAVEIWHFHMGAPLALDMSEDGKEQKRHVLGTNVINGEHPQIVVPTQCWQSAQSLGAWTLVGCTVSPAFLFETFEMAPDGWSPGL